MSKSQTRIQLANGGSVISSTDFEELREKLLKAGGWLDALDESNPDGSVLVRLDQIVAIHKTSIETSPGGRR